MINFYAWTTPNAEKIAIMLHETELPYRFFPIDLTQQQQFAPDFLKISPNNKIPAIVDENGPGDLPISIFESGAILMYLADKAQRFIPQEIIRRWACMQWLMFQVASVGPMFGQLNHFLLFAQEKIPYAIDRYTKEVQRLYRIMDLHLSRNEYFAIEYSITDMAIFPWVNIFEKQQINLDDYPHVKDWHKKISQRKAVQRALERLESLTSLPT